MKRLLFIGIILMILSACSNQNKTNLQDLLGKEANSQSIQDYLKTLGEPKVSNYDDGFYYTYKDKGISLSFDKSSILDAIFLYAENYDAYLQFQGKIPYGIVMADKRADVEKKLGTPSNSDGAGIIDSYSEWEDEGIMVTYNTKDDNDMTASIGSIGLSKK